jgi:Phage derived protein Gp49-like (DUF891)
MKELRFNCDDGKWRIAFAFDPKRTAVLLVAGNKVGADQRRFYEQLIDTADARFDAHLVNLEREQAKLKQGKSKLVPDNHHDVAVAPRHSYPNVVILAMEEHVHRARAQAQVAQPHVIQEIR